VPPGVAAVGTAAGGGTAADEGTLRRVSQQDARGPWLVTFAATLWALDAPFRKHLTIDLSSTSIVLMEHLMVAVCILPLFVRRLGELRNLGWKEWFAVIFIGIGGSALATILFTQSFHYLNPTVAILLQKMQPLIAILLAAVVLREHVSRTFWLWAAVALGGAYVISFPDLKPAGFAWTPNTRGTMLALGAAVFWGGSTVFGRFALNRVSFQMTTSLRFLSAVVFLPFLSLYEGTLHEVGAASAADWFFVFMTAILAGLVSLLIYYYGLRSTKASIATMCELAYPFASTIINWAVLGATLAPLQIAGGSVLLVAIARLTVVNNRETRTVATAASY
jgi:drug/metabolite transporter (DMT)-like permease